MKPLEQPKPERVVRPEDQRPRHDENRLADAGIRVFESQRLKLHTDLDPEIARTLPPLIDQVYLAWEEYFGPLPPDRSETPFQISGYLMRDVALFRELGLLPEDLQLQHGRHRRNEFWMRDQSEDYYRRHLLIHEATHCFMMFLPGVEAPVWYLEGMAEDFGTHRLDENGKATFRVMANSPEECAGFGRITLIREDCAANKFRSIPSIMQFQPAEFVTPNHYAWAWGLCQFLDRHPQYHERFQRLSDFLQGAQLNDKFVEFFAADGQDLNTEWALFISNLQYGYDVARASIEFRPGTLLTFAESTRSFDIQANRGWQSSGVQIETGQTYDISASGRFILADQPQPWESEPQGVSIRYFEGHPLGILLACIRQDTPEDSEEPMLNVATIGRGRILKAPATGTLYFRLNDAWNSLNDNNGHVTVKISLVSG